MQRPDWLSLLKQDIDLSDACLKSVMVSGRVIRSVGLILEGIGFSAPIGQLCQVETASTPILAEVIGFSNEKMYLMPFSECKNAIVNARITPLDSSMTLSLSPSLLGRTLDGLGQPLDDLGSLSVSDIQISSEKINPLKRKKIEEPLDVGIKAINACLTIGKGQRMGIFAGSGVGKSVTLGMMAKGTTADVIVVALIGERGREVQEFLDTILTVEERSNTVVIAAPADSSPLMRLKGCENALSIAAYFRDLGNDVLLLFDSLTRFAQAQREIALAMGEPPATKGYPPSVFAKLPALVELAGNSDCKQGSLTAFFTVLTEGDDLQDPIADASRAILDGHIVLARELADSGHYPAIDVERSVSRVMSGLVSSNQWQMALRVRQWLSIQRKYQELLSIGAYKLGTDPKIDHALAQREAVTAFLQQGQHESVSFAESIDGLSVLTGG